MEMTLICNRETYVDADRAGSHKWGAGFVVELQMC